MAGNLLSPIQGTWNYLPLLFFAAAGKRRSLQGGIPFMKTIFSTCGKTALYVLSGESFNRPRNRMREGGLEQNSSKEIKPRSRHAAAFKRRGNSLLRKIPRGPGKRKKRLSDYSKQLYDHNRELWKQWMDLTFPSSFPSPRAAGREKNDYRRTKAHKAG
jgi:hypothetical protein